MNIKNELSVAKNKAYSGERLTKKDALLLYEDNDLLFFAKCARRQKERKSGNNVFYIVNKHINLTNICSSNCPLCAFQCKSGDKQGYTLEIEDIDKILVDTKNIEGLSEIHIVSALHPTKTFEYYINIVKQILAFVHLHLLK